MEGPTFPQFQPIMLEDRDNIHQVLWQYQPATSEMTFSNLFLWRGHYGLSWCHYDNCLIILAEPPHETPWLFPPIGPSGRGEICRRLLAWLRDSRGAAEPRINRADSRLAAEIASIPDLNCEPQRDHFDYVYRTADLVNLTGNKYHSKRNHINSLKKSISFEYLPLEEVLLDDCLNLADRWCEFKRCDEDLNLVGEWEAIRLSLLHYQELSLKGGVILVGGKVEAFSLGEMLNQQTAVIHFEKANPEISGLYSLINQQFCENAWKHADFINREQDLGEEGLRKAKMSYNPEHLEEKFRITLA